MAKYFFSMVHLLIFLGLTYIWVPQKATWMEPALTTMLIATVILIFDLFDHLAANQMRAGLIHSSHIKLVDRIMREEGIGFGNGVSNCLTHFGLCVYNGGMYVENYIRAPDLFNVRKGGLFF